jgi:hypothetical protein
MELNLKELAQTGEVIKKAATVGGDIEGGDFLDKIIKITSNIKDLTETFQNLKGTQAPVSDGFNEKPRLLPHDNQSQAVKQETPKQGGILSPQMISAISGYLNECEKINPKMTIGEAIMNLPFTASQVNSLLKMGGMK